jgi:hypothetical protein
MNIKELGCKEVLWIDLAQDSDQCFSHVNVASNCIFKKFYQPVLFTWFFTPSEGFLPFLGGICCFLLQGG